MKIKLSSTIKFITIFLFATITSNAADLIVRHDGAGGAYTTISAAITAAADGDRIIIRPKPSNVPYLESLTIDKSLTFVSEIHGDKYEVQGNINLTFVSNRKIIIHDLNLINFRSIREQGSSFLSTDTDRAEVYIINSTISGNILLDYGRLTINVFGCSFDELEFKHGKIIGNEGREIRLNYEGGSNALSNEDVYIIANKIINGSLECEPRYNLNIYNNFIQTNLSSQIPLILATGHNGSSYTYMVVNNYIETTSTHSVQVATPSSGMSINLINNIINAQNSIHYEVIVNSSNPYVQLTNNMSPTDFRVTSNADVDTNNIANATLSTTDFFTTGDNVNAGVADTSYIDIDLTVNDIGPHGGSFTWANFWTGEVQKPHIYFLNTPRIIFNGTTTFEVNGIGTTN